MKKLFIAVASAVMGLVNIYAVDAWYQTTPWYMTDMEIYLVMITCIVVANLTVSGLINRINFKKKTEVRPVNWISVDED